MNRKNVEDLYPLTPLQQGMLFHALHSPEADAYAEQVALTLQGDVRPEAFAAAWQAVVDRNPALRTGFVWEGVKQPMQVVYRQAAVPVRTEDWSALPHAEREARWAALLEDDRAAGWELRRAPLIRLALARVGDAEWRFLLSSHHLLMDGWSMALVFADFAAAYDAVRNGREAILPRRPAFRDYVAWIGERPEGAAEAFWRARLGGLDEPTPLPLDRAPARAGRPAQEHGQETLPIPADTVAALMEAARRHRVTASTLAQAAWAVVLARHTGRREVVFGTTVSGRPPEVPGVEEMVGLFINTVPVLVRVPPAEPLAEWLRALQSEQAEARDHELAPLARIRAWSGLPGEAPLFETIFVYENYPVGGGGGAGEEPAFAVTSARAAERTNYALSLVMAPAAGGMRATATYDARRLDPDRVRALLAGYRAVLEQMVSGTAPVTGALTPLTADERARLVAAGSATASFDVDTLPARFAAQAARTPDAAAVTFGGESVTYAELDARANRIAHRLVKLGARPDSLVGLFVERSVDTVAGILAILKAGAGYLPLDPAYPEDRLAYMLEDSGVPIVLTTSALRGRLPAGTAILCLQCDADAIAAEPSDAPAIDISPASLAYVIYTSGSTGKPKGVQVTHTNVVRLFAATDAWFGFGADDVWTLFHSYAFDFSVWEMWGALLYGGRLVVVPFDVTRSPEEFYALLGDEGVTVLNQTPSAFRQLMRVDEEAAERGEMRELALRHVVFGGEALEPASLRGWVERRGDDRPSLVNMYGITETTVHVTYRVIRAADTVNGSSSPIGIPIPDLAVHLLDRDGQFVPTGAAGEMYVGGAGVARGYLNRPELTAQRFVPDPFSADADARLYRSGDLARRLEDGSLEFLGRADDQVKVRGFRIEPGEIESALLAHPSVREAVVLARGEGEERRLVAWIVAEGVDAAGLRAHLLDRLPDYMVPAAWSFLDALPLTRNGKVDRRALPEPDAAAADVDEYVAPRTPVEETLARVWEAVLRVERVGVHDDFFALGGDSILSLQVISRAAKEGVRVTPRQVFEHPTVAGLAAVAGGAGADAEQGLVTGPVPLTPVQRWFFGHALEDPSHSNLSMVVEAAGPVDPALLERALHRLALHHDALRLRFTRGADGWTQAGTRDAAVPVETVDLAAVPADERSQAREEAKARAERGLALEAGPLLRAVLLRGDGPDRVLLATHHLVVDVVSWRVLLEDLETVYTQLARGEAVRLMAKTTSWQAWTGRLADAAGSPALEAEAAFWVEQGAREVAPL
ncbi:MAG TPA: amino acid adenylation domain-containing protein, partial [Longimicrobium sp.]|nr:amino acid adenylation domain-containing protein [Longimicrobium sp.]